MAMKSPVPVAASLAPSGKSDLGAPEAAAADGHAHLELADQLLAVPDARLDGGLRGPLPSAAETAVLAGDLFDVLFPTSGGLRADCDADQRECLAGALVSLERRLGEAVFLGLHRRCRSGAPNGTPTPGKDKAEVDDCCDQAKAIVHRLLAALPGIRGLLVKDVEAALESDPAATGPEEVIACYPGLYAVAIYRTAHQLLKEGAAIVPRMLTEHAKSRTGIDIHPGAQIGPSFFIDHGTGIVIGETTQIGSSVRIYQGVTLGALSIKRRLGQGQSAHLVDKRHPTIEDDVVIYANATILGGDTVIGRGAVIGGNSFITYSVPPGIRVGVGR
jgi:serine O-acetyltransferase